MEAHHNKMEYGSEGEEILIVSLIVSLFWRLLEASIVGHGTGQDRLLKAIRLLRVKHVFLQGALKPVALLERAVLWPYLFMFYTVFHG